MRKIIFIDRDGTIVEEPEDFQVDRLDKIIWVKDVITTLKKLVELGYELVMVSNQDGLGTTSFPRPDFEICQNYIVNTLCSQGIPFSDILICPHFSKDQCECRKPKIGLMIPYLTAKNIDWKQSWFLGDRDTDKELAEKIGVNFFRIVPTENSFLSFLQTIKDKHRSALIHRKTKETSCKVFINLDDSTPGIIKTGIGFFDHMLDQIQKHANIHLSIEVIGDLHIDDHHTIEDTALTLGQALAQALGDKRGINRYAFTLPMDEVKAEVCIDLSGRSGFFMEGDIPITHCGEFHTEMLQHFFKSLCDSASFNMHLKISQGNSHHMIEGAFKAFAKTLKTAIKLENGMEIPSTKGEL